MPGTPEGMIIFGIVDVIVTIVVVILFLKSSNKKEK